MHAPIAKELDPRCLPMAHTVLAHNVEMALLNRCGLSNRVEGYGSAREATHPADFRASHASRAPTPPPVPRHRLRGLREPLDTRRALRPLSR